WLPPVRIRSSPPRKVSELDRGLGANEVRCKPLRVRTPYLPPKVGCRSGQTALFRKQMGVTATGVRIPHLPPMERSPRGLGRLLGKQVRATFVGSNPTLSANMVRCRSGLSELP